VGRPKYRYDGKEKRLSFGIYPDVSLKDARDRRGTDHHLEPSAHPQEIKIAARSLRTDCAAGSFLK